MQKHTYENVAHVEDGDRHAVATALRVLISPADAGGYVAQGLDIDYVATADSIEAVKQRFAEGLIKTIESLLKRKRPISALFKSRSPQEAWQTYIDNGGGDALVCATVVDLRAKLPPRIGFPFASLEYCETAETSHA